MSFGSPIPSRQSPADRNPLRTPDAGPQSDSITTMGCRKANKAADPPANRVLDAALGQLRGIVEEELDGLRATVYLFGSAAKGRMGRSSDVDIAVETPVEPPAGRLARLRERIAESTIPYQVDVVLLNEADSSLRERILREGARWIG